MMMIIIIITAVYPCVHVSIHACIHTYTILFGVHILLQLTQIRIWSHGLIMLFSVLTSVPYAIALSTSLLARSWSSPLLPPIRSMSSVNRRLRMGLPAMEMDMLWSLSVSSVFLSMSTLNRMGESKHPWQTPTVFLKNSPSWLLEFSCMNGLNQTFLFVEAYEDLPQACKVVEQIALVL